MDGYKGHAHSTAVAQLRQRGVGMAQNIPFQLAQRLPGKRGLAARIVRLGLNLARIPVALKNVLHRALGYLETLGDLAHGLAVNEARVHNTLAKVNGSWSHAYSITP